MWNGKLLKTEYLFEKFQCTMYSKILLQKNIRNVYFFSGEKNLKVSFSVFQCRKDLLFVHKLMRKEDIHHLEKGLGTYSYTYYLWLSRNSCDAKRTVYKF